MIYANSAATSWPKPPAVQAAIAENLQSSPWCWPDVEERVRREFATLCATTWPQGLRLCSGATAGLSIFMDAFPWRPGDVILTSEVEHHALARPLFSLARHRGVEVECMAYAPGRPIDVVRVRERLRKRPVRAIAVATASNVTGELLPIMALGTLAREHGVMLILDAAQSVGVVPLEIDAVGAHVVAFAGHKGPHGPHGIGGLWLARGLDCERLTRSRLCDGDGMGYCELGGINVAGAAGLAAGLAWLRAGGAARQGAHARQLRSRLWQALSQRDRCQLLGGAQVESTAALSLVIDGLDIGRAGAAFARHGVCLRGGHHCAPMALRALGQPQGSIRMSLGPMSTTADVDGILEAVDAVIAEV